MVKLFYTIYISADIANLHICKLSHNEIFRAYVGKGHTWIQKGDRGFGPPLKKHKHLGFLSNTGPDPLKKSQSCQARILCWTIIDTPAKRHVNGVSLAGRW